MLPAPQKRGESAGGMNNMLNNLEGHEVLQASNLDKYTWPLADPAQVDQPSRPWNGADSIAIARAATLTNLTPDRFLQQTANMPLAVRLHWLLSHDAVNFNGVTRVREEPKWASRLEAIAAAGEPIPIVYPLFCSIANPAKQMTRPGPNAGELASIHFFLYVDEMVRAVYQPGIRVHILSDAVLYNNALQNTPSTALAYVQKARQMVKDANAEHCVTVHDYTELLAPFSDEFDQLYNSFYKRLAAGDETLIGQQDRGRLLRSIRASVNTERFGLSYEDCRALFGPEPDASHPLAADIERMAQAALREQLAVKLACVQLDLPERLWPGHIRASCHKGVKSGVAVVGLRVYPEYYRRSKLLPYHGKPLVRADGRLVVQPEFELRGRGDLIRVVNEAGESLLYRE
jgi:pyoverdine/dityrosine biosynthesis protein Dit1